MNVGRRIRLILCCFGFKQLRSLWFLVDRSVNISLSVGMKFKCLLILPLLVTSLQAASVDDLTFTLNGGGGGNGGGDGSGGGGGTKYVVTDCLETASGSLDIPSTYNGYPVTSIGNQAFDNRSGLTTITIPDSITSIGEYAFRGCSGLTNITLPNNIKFTIISNQLLRDCTGLTSVTIPNSVTSIGEYAFKNCTSLTSITLPNNIEFTIISNELFRDCTGLTSVTVPNSVTSIEEYAFKNCTSLTSITIPDSVSSIEQGAFNLCTSLTSITIPDSVTSIGSQTLRDCTSLTTATIGKSVTSIGISAFRGCSGLTSITIPDSVTSIGTNAFYNCSSLSSVRFEGDAPTTIETDSFSNTQISYIIVGGSEAASYGGDGTTFNGLMVVDYSKVATAANLYTLDETADLRAGSTMIAVSGNQATVELQMEESSDLESWTVTGDAATMVVPADSDTKFFRFKMAE